METVSTSDLYEVSYYYLSGCTIESIECVPVNGVSHCRFTLSGSRIANLQATYFNGQALVNLHQFRRSYVEINRYSYEAKKRWKQEKKSAGAEVRHE